MEIQEAMVRYPWLGELLHELTGEQRSRISVRRYRPEEIMIEHCKANYYTYLLLEGVCCTVQTMENGARVVLRKATIGDVVGFSGIYQEEPDFAARISARTAVTAVLLPKPLVQECFGKYRDFSIQISRRVIDRLHALVSLLSECNNYPSYLGLVTYLCYNYRFYARSCPEGYRGPVRIVESRQNIADFLGIDVRSVQRLLRRLREQAVVSLAGRSICIDQTQYEALQELRREWFLQ